MLLVFEVNCAGRAMYFTENLHMHAFICHHCCCGLDVCLHQLGVLLC
jgi:hypothetical protein